MQNVWLLIGVPEMQVLLVEISSHYLQEIWKEYIMDKVRHSVGIRFSMVLTNFRTQKKYLLGLYMCDLV